MKKPFSFSIDIVGRCNLHCASCPQGNDEHRLAKVFMERRVLHAILKKATREANVFKVELFNWGEPFTHPRLAEMVKIVHSHGLLCFLSSNLNIVPNIHDVMAEEPHELRISCSGFSQEVYEKTHCGGDITKVRANMRLISQIRTPRTKVYVLWHRYKHNAHEEAQMREYCEWCGFGFQPVEAYYMPLETVLDVWDGSKSTPELDSNLLTSLDEHRSLCQGRSMPCRNQTESIAIDAQGNVQLCCGVYDSSRFTVCNFLETPLRDIQSRRFNHSFCDRCIGSGGHVYVTGFSHSNPSVVRNAAKAVYNVVSPLVPKSILKLAVK